MTRAFVLVVAVMAAGCTGDNPDYLGEPEPVTALRVPADTSPPTCGRPGEPCCRDAEGRAFCTAGACFGERCAVPDMATVPDLVAPPSDLEPFRPARDLAALPDLAPAPDFDCGGCSPAANAVVSCVRGACAVTCDRGFEDCDGNGANGCEASLNADAQNCGKCGRACQFNCLGGSCFPF